MVKKINKKYVPDSLTPSQKRKHIKSIANKIDRPKLNIRNRKSKYTIMANKYFNNNTSLSNMSKVLKIKMKGLDDIMKKGLGAYYSSGSRPNQTAHSWAKARVYSVLFGGKAREVDYDIVIKYNIPLLKIPK